MSPKKLAEEAWHIALAHIQDHYETDGGFADIYFDDGAIKSGREKVVKTIFENYAEAEQARSGKDD